MLPSIITSLLLFFGLIGGLEFGRWLGRRSRDSDVTSVGGTTAADGVVFAVLGLLVAFTFTASASRFHERRRLIVEQANALSTAWLRVDLLPEVDRPAIRQRMQAWVQLAGDIGRLQREAGAAETMAAIGRAERLQNEVWQLAVASVDRHPKPPVASLVLAPLNEWIDLTTTRLAMTNMGAPPLVLTTLVVLSLAASVLCGFNMAKSASRSPLHILAFAGTITFSIYVVLDLDHPRSGLIRLDAIDDVMIQLNESFRSGAGVPTTNLEEP
jgi:hypothetical protein